MIVQMKEKLKKLWDKTKTFWGGLAKKVKVLIIAAAAVIIVGAIVLTMILNKPDGWIVLFPDMTSDESAEVYRELQAMDVETKLNSDGEIEVREEDWDMLVYELAERGYPQSAPSYGTFFDNLSMTMSEFEKKQTLRFELQDRIQTTLKRIDGVKGAIVTISFPETTNYVWKESEEVATASVMLTLENGVEFGSDQVQAIKNIVAYSAQQVAPEDVTVVNAATGEEMLVVVEEPKEQFGDEERINYEKMIQDKYEANARKILAPIYGEDGVTAAASVTIDYDKITQEMKELITDENGEGVKQNQHIEYGVDGVVDPGGVVGEEDNTDIPNYGNLEDDLNSDNTPHYIRDTEWAIGYILTQTERSQGGITDASIAVVVATESGVLTEDESEMITQLVMNATNIPRESVSVGAKLAAVPGEVPGEEPGQPGEVPFYKKPMFKYLLIAGIILLIALIILIAVLINRRAKKKIAQAQAESQAEIEKMKQTIEEDKLKRMSIEEAAKEHADITNATANDVKEFAKKNPQIAAALIRSMMKEQHNQ